MVSVHFNHFPCMGICDKLSRHLSMLTYIHLNVDECWLTSSMPHQRFKLKLSVMFGKCGFLKYINVKGSFDVAMVITSLLIPWKPKEW